MVSRPLTPSKMVPYHAFVKRLFDVQPQSFRFPISCVHQCPSSWFATPVVTVVLPLLLLGVAPRSGWTHPITNLQSPQSFIAHPSGEGYFIANANGDPGVADNNGFISKLNRDGELLDRHFIQGGHADTILHSPNGMAVVGQTLYVADLDGIRGFHAQSGKATVTVSLSAFHVEELTDLIADGADQLFVLDTAGAAIYQIDTRHDHAVSLYLQHEDLASPRGLAVHPRSGRLLVASFDKGTVMEIAEDRTITETISNSLFSGKFRNLSGIDFDQFGNMYLSDVTAGKVWRVHPNRSMQVIAEFLISPSTVKIDRRNHRILVPYLYADGAEMNGLERPSNTSNQRKRKRTLSDYGLGWLEGDAQR